MAEHSARFVGTILQTSLLDDLVQEQEVVHVVSKRYFPIVMPGYGGRNCAPYYICFLVMLAARSQFSNGNGKFSLLLMAQCEPMYSTSKH